MKSLVQIQVGPPPKPLVPKGILFNRQPMRRPRMLSRAHQRRRTSTRVGHVPRSCRHRRFLWELLPSLQRATLRGKQRPIPHITKPLCAKKLSGGTDSRVTVIGFPGRTREAPDLNRAPPSVDRLGLWDHCDAVLGSGSHRRVGSEVCDQGVQIDLAPQSVGASNQDGEIVSSVGQEAVHRDPII